MSNAYLDAREEYVERVKKELLGPGSEVCIPDIERELISSSPSVEGGFRLHRGGASHYRRRRSRSRLPALRGRVLRLTKVSALGTRQGSALGTCKGLCPLTPPRTFFEKKVLGTPKNLNKALGKHL